MSPVEPRVPPGEYELPPMVGKQTAFIVLSSLLYALLFFERGVYAQVGEGTRSSSVGALVVALATVLTLGGFLASYYLPPIIRPEHDQRKWIPHTLNFLMGQFGISVVCVVVTSVAALALYAWLVAPNLVAMAWLVRDGLIYIAVGALVCHGYVLFVRYAGFLYQTGGDDRLKIIVFQAAAAAFIVLFGLYQYTVDVVQMLGAQPGQGAQALHLAVRDVLLVALVAVIFVWQIGRAGDH